MRHRYNKIVLNKSRAHTKATVRSLITSLVEHGRIKTTAKKAKILKAQMEKLISRSKKRTLVHAIREAGKVFFTKEASKKFFDEYLPATGDRKSGYIRTFRLANRSGDNATQVLLELIDYPAAKEQEKVATTKSKKVTK